VKSFAAGYALAMGAVNCKDSCGLQALQRIGFSWCATLQSTRHKNPLAGKADT